MSRKRDVFGTVAAATGGFACGCSFRAAVGKEIKGGDPTMACWHVKRWRSHRKRESRCAQRRSMQTHVLSDRSRYFCTEFSRMARDASENRHRRGLRAVSGMAGERVFLPRSQFSRLEFCPDSLLKLVSHFCRGEQESFGPLSEEEEAGKRTGQSSLRTAP